MELDAAIDGVPPRCDTSRPFGTPTPVPGINTANEENGGWLSADELRIYFSIGPANLMPGQRDLYTATRPTVGDPFGVPTKLDTVSSPSTSDQQPSLTADELTMFLVRGSTTKIYVTKRSDAQSAFGAPAALDSVNDPASTIYDDSPWISADGLTIYFSSTRSGNFDHELYQATRTSATAPFSGTSILTNVKAPGNDSGVVVRGDELEMFFASNREQIMYPEGYTNDIYRSTRNAKSDPWGVPTKVTELAAPSNEGPTWVSSDGCVLVFSSSRSGAGSYDLWMTSRM